MKITLIVITVALIIIGIASAAENDRKGYNSRSELHFNAYCKVNECNGLTLEEFIVLRDTHTLPNQKAKTENYDPIPAMAAGAALQQQMNIMSGN